MSIVNQAADLLRQGQPSQALAVLGDHLGPEPGVAWRLAAEAFLALGRSVEAHAALGRAPRDVDTALVHVSILEHQGRHDEAMTCLRALPDTPSVHLRRGNLALLTGDLDRAWHDFEAALHACPGLVEGLVGRTVVLDRQGRPAEAAASLEAIVRTGQAPPRLVWAWASAAVRVQPQQVPERIPAALPRARGQTRGLLLHVLGQAHDRLDQHEQAFRAYAQANQVRRVPFDGPAFFAGSQELVRRTRVPGPTSTRTQRTPILVVGAPRSGTTLVETLLSLHPDIAAAGELQTGRLLALHAARSRGVSSWEQASLTPAELDELADRYLAELEPHRGGAARVVDKTPGNALLLGFFAAMLPGLTVVHCVRDPLDVAWSCYRQPFPASLGWTTSLAGIGWWLRTERTLMAHWRATLDVPIVTVSYESLVGEPESALRPVLRATGLPWHAAVARYEGGRTDASTASWAEVRQGVHARSVGRSAPYRPWLGEVEQVLREGLAAAA